MGRRGGFLQYGLESSQDTHGLCKTLLFLPQLFQPIAVFGQQIAPVLQGIPGGTEDGLQFGKAALQLGQAQGDGAGDDLRGDLAALRWAPLLDG